MSIKHPQLFNILKFYFVPLQAKHQFHSLGNTISEDVHNFHRVFVFHEVDKLQALVIVNIALSLFFREGIYHRHKCFRFFESSQFFILLYYLALFFDTSLIVLNLCFVHFSLPDFGKHKLQFVLKRG